MRSELNGRTTPKERKRSRTLSRKLIAREYRRMKKRGELLEIIDHAKPRTREDCHKMARPCLYVSCRHHLYLDVNEETGSVKLNFPDKEVWELEETCALDVAESGGITLEEAGAIMNLTRERIRQIEISGMRKLGIATGGDDQLEGLILENLGGSTTESDS